MAGFEIMDLFRDVRQAKHQTALLDRRQAGVEELLGGQGVDQGIALPPGQQGPPGPGGEIVGGGGLLADPTDLRRQVEFAGGLEALGQGGGTGLLGQIFGQEQQQGQFDASKQQQQEQFDTAAAQQQGQFDRTLAQRIAEFDNPATKPLTAAEQRAAAQASINDPFEAFNPLTLGQPQNGVVRVDPKQQGKQQSEHDTTSQMLRQTNRARELIDEFGSEVWNADAVGEFVNLRADLLLRSSGLRGAGAPQGAELEISGKGLPDPQSLFNNLTSPLRIGERDKWAAAYKSFGSQVSDTMLSQLGTNPTLASDLDGLSEEFIDSRGISPEMWDLFQETRGQRLD